MEKVRTQASSGGIIHSAVSIVFFSSYDSNIEKLSPLSVSSLDKFNEKEKALIWSLLVFTFPLSILDDKPKEYVAAVPWDEDAKREEFCDKEKKEIAWNNITSQARFLNHNRYPANLMSDRW